MEELNSDKESFYSADSLENLCQESKLNKNRSVSEGKQKYDVFNVPFYEVRTSTLNNNSKRGIKTNKKIPIPNRVLNSNKLAYDSNNLALDLRSLRTSSASTGIPSKCRSSSVEPVKKVQGLISNSNSSSKSIDQTNVVRSRNRSVSYLEQYRKRLASSCNRNSLHNSITGIDVSDRNYSHRENNNFIHKNALNGSQNKSLNVSTKDYEVQVPFKREIQSLVSTDRSSKNNIEKQEICTTNFDNSDKVGNFLMKIEQNKLSFDNKLASYKKRKEYGEIVKKKNQEEMLIQKAQSKTKIRERLIDKRTFNNESFNTQIEKPLPPKAFIEKRKEFSEKVKHKNREDFINQKIQFKTVNLGKPKENMVTNDECFTQNIDSTIIKNRVLVKQSSSMTQRKKESFTKIKDHSKNSIEEIDLKALQMRHEKDKIKAKNILDEFLKT